MDGMKSQETQLQKSSKYVLNNLYIEKSSEDANSSIIIMQTNNCHSLTKYNSILGVVQSEQ